MSKKVITELVCIDLGQKTILNGVLWRSDESTSKTAIALFSGTGAEFFNSLFVFLGPRLAAAGYMTLSLNRRDHGSQFGFHSLVDAAGDQGLGIDYLVSQGAEKVILGGHSYGTVTVPFYVSETNDPRVVGMLLYAPLGDLRLASINFTTNEKRRIKYFFLNNKSQITVVFFHGFMSDMHGAKPSAIQKYCR